MQPHDKNVFYAEHREKVLEKVQDLFTFYKKYDIINQNEVRK